MNKIGIIAGITIMVIRNADIDRVDGLSNFLEIHFIKTPYGSKGDRSSAFKLRDSVPYEFTVRNFLAEASEIFGVNFIDESNVKDFV